jgi:hypothetical protein
MGHLFHNAEPWNQVFQQLDLLDMSAEKFVGILESAAQAADSRALIIIDALNEGAGRKIWPNHLAAFLKHIERSPWVSVVLSVRSSYESLIPGEVKNYAVNLEHDGFANNEYDATRTFFLHYNLELPSTPILAPEFRNPLFLKVLCEGLNLHGNHRFPRGFHGITATFKLFTDAINVRLAKKLNFNPKKLLVHLALDALAKSFIETEERWLPLTTAENTVNAILPNREFDHSLYRGLVSEGLLFEARVSQEGGESEEGVFIAYERFGDYLVTSSLLDTHLDISAPNDAFEEGGGLEFLSSTKRYIYPSLLEALCLQIPELTGKELIEFVPAIKERWNIGDAFRKSLIWRDSKAFSDETLVILDKLIRTEYDWDETMDMFLTVSTLPEHPFNAFYLDKRLKYDSMAERDSWWSSFIHNSWQNHGAVYRLVDWASNLTSQNILDDESVELCSITLAWMLTSSNRFLRDHATKALVSLLTGRLDTVANLVNRFVDVDDPYVNERVYAVAYGTSMRSHNPEDVGNLALCVYSKVFGKISVHHTIVHGQIFPQKMNSQRYWTSGLMNLKMVVDLNSQGSI